MTGTGHIEGKMNRGGQAILLTSLCDWTSERGAAGIVKGQSLLRGTRDDRLCRAIIISRPEET